GLIRALVDLDLRTTDEELVDLQFRDVCAGDDEAVAFGLFGEFERIALDVQSFLIGLLGRLVYLDLAFGPQPIQLIFAAVGTQQPRLDQMGAQIYRPGGLRVCLRCRGHRPRRTRYRRHRHARGAGHLGRQLAARWSVLEGED